MRTNVLGKGGGSATRKQIRASASSWKLGGAHELGAASNKLLVVATGADLQLITNNNNEQRVELTKSKLDGWPSRPMSGSRSDFSFGSGLLMPIPLLLLLPLLLDVARWPPTATCCCLL